MKSNQEKKYCFVPKNNQGCPLDSPRNTQDTTPIKISAGQAQPTKFNTWKTYSVKIQQTPKVVGISRLSEQDLHFLTHQIIAQFLSCQIIKKSCFIFQVNTWTRTADFGKAVSIRVSAVNGWIFRESLTWFHIEYVSYITLPSQTEVTTLTKSIF